LCDIETDFVQYGTRLKFWRVRGICVQTDFFSVQNDFSCENLVKREDWTRRGMAQKNPRRSGNFVRVSEMNPRVS
jgi:hypothetical protein